MKKKLTDLSVAEVIRESFSGGPKWRGAPFWALNGQLSATEIREQIRGFQKCGLGGFFLHSRTGLQTPYLSEAFFDGMAAAVDEAEKCQMQAWLYDEDRYPSGSGGGFVTCDPAFRAKGIFLAEIPFEEAGSFEIPFQPLALFAGVVQNDEISHLRRLVKEDKLRLNPEETLLYT